MGLNYFAYYKEFCHQILQSNLLLDQTMRKDSKQNGVDKGLLGVPGYNPNAKAMTLSHSQFLENSIKYLINPKMNQFMNFHSRLCQNLDISEEDNYVLMYKTHFIKDPPHIAWVLYSVKNEKIMILVYNMVMQNLKKIDVSIDFAERFLPFIRVGLKNHEYLNIGKRVFKCLKNSLIIEYSNLTSWQDVIGVVGDFGESLEQALGLRRPLGADKNNDAAMAKRLETFQKNKLLNKGLLTQDPEFYKQNTLRAKKNEQKEGKDGQNIAKIIRQFRGLNYMNNDKKQVFKESAQSSLMFNN